MFKLRLLSKVEDVLSTKRLHNELLDAGLLGGACHAGMPPPGFAVPRWGSGCLSPLLPSLGCLHLLVVCQQPPTGSPSPATTCSAQGLD